MGDDDAPSSVPDRGFGDFDAELQELSVNARGTPGRVGVAHLADERPYVLRNPWSTRPARPTLPSPVEPKPASMPPEDRVGRDDDDRVPPAGPEATEPRPEQPIDGPQSRSAARLSLQDRQLMPQRGVLDLERRPAPQARTTRGEEDETDGPHGPSG